MNTIVLIMREISKVVMFTLLWGFPLYLSRVTGNSGYLWFLTLSVVFTLTMFSHYEDLEKIDMLSGNFKKQEDE